MCGLAGILTNDGTGADALRDTVERMASTIVHRGPDDSGTWIDEKAGVAIGFRRLAIIDLSRHGHQPMVSNDGRLVIAYNGEIYNYRELRAELESFGARFRGHSDTEVLLAAIQRWGIADAISRLIGMFAIVLWDAEERRLHFVRDRLGIKPLFVGQMDRTVVFGSELKALLASRRLDRRLDAEALSAYFRYLYVPAPRTIFTRVRKLLPGHWLTVSDPEAPLPEPVPYWNLEEVAAEGIAARGEVSEESVAEEASYLLREAVRCRMHADVPLGAFLSGGIDSSLVVALMQSVADTPVRTYSVAFEEHAYNEAALAARIACHLGTDHREVMLTSTEARRVVASLAEMFDEPFASPSAIPNHLISRVARDGVTVALSGTGGDEVFAGYNRYTYGRWLIETLLRLPEGLRRPIATSMARGRPLTATEEMLNHLPARIAVRHLGRKLHKLERLAAAGSSGEAYRSLISSFQDPDAVVAGVAEPRGRFDRAVAQGGPGFELLDRMLLADQLTYLADDQLHKTDRASMAVGLEVRVPLVDHRLVELSWRLPSALKVRRLTGKQLLRREAYRLIPRQMLQRPKMGLSVPVARWLREPLREWAEDLLAPESIRQSGLLDAHPIRREWSALLAGEDHADLPVWAALMFQAWYQTWGREGRIRQPEPARAVGSGGSLAETRS